ncbi:MAG: AsmA family protein, partial [bacterium]
MSRLFKIIAVLVALPVLGVISLLLILDNPTVYQEPIGDAFRQKTGLELNFNGDIQWRFFPPLAININEIEIKSPDSDTPLASLNSASIDLKLIPIILEGKIVIEAIEIDGVDLNAVVSEQGIGNWERPDTADSPPLALPSNSAPAAETESETEPDSQDLNLDISAFTLTNAHIDYQDLSAKTHMMLNIDKLSTGQLSPGQLTELNTIFSFEDKIEKLSAKTQIDGSFKVSDNLVQLTLENFVVDATILQQDQVEVAATIKINAEIDSDKATASFSNSSINVADLVILLTLKANNIFTIPGLRGNISIPAFDAKKLAKEMAIEIPATSNPDALTSVSVTTDITGTTDQMVFSNITATLDRSTITGKATITLEPESALEFSLAMDAINATGYLEPDVSTSAVAVVEKTPASAQAANDTTTAINIPDSEVIPIELLNELALQGTFTLAELQYDEYLLHDITVDMNNKNQTLTLASRAVGYDGQLGLDLHLKPLAPGQNPTGRIQL